MVSTGQKAPDFVASAVQDGAGRPVEFFAEVRAHEAVVLVFEPAAFVPTCTAELCAIRDAGWTDVEGLAVFVVTGDSLFSNAAYADRYDLPFPLVSDFHGGIAHSYDLLLEEWEGHSDIPGRATVVVDGDWTVRTISSADPLAEADPSPVETATETLADLGLDVSRPRVQYEAFVGDP